MQTSKRKVLSAALAGALLATGLMPAGAQTFPDKPVKIIVPYAAGGGVDNIARVVALHLATRLKQPVIIDNRPGANANIGTDAAVKSPADGYTLMMGATFLAFNRATMKSLSFDPLNDLAPVARAAKAPYILSVPGSSPFKSVAELVTWMKANPDKASFGAVGAGSLTQLIFVKNTGTAPVQVLYKGGSAALPDLMAGRLTFMIQTASEVLPHIASGKLRALAVTGTERFKALPDVPTMTQAGVANLESIGWWGLFAPAKTPAPIVARLSTEVQAVMAMPEVAAALSRLGAEPAPQTATEFDRFYRKEVRDYAEVAREFKITVE